MENEKTILISNELTKIKNRTNLVTEETFIEFNDRFGLYSKLNPGIKMHEQIIRLTEDVTTLVKNPYLLG